MLRKHQWSIVPSLVKVRSLFLALFIGLSSAQLPKSSTEFNKGNFVEKLSIAVEEGLFFGWLYKMDCVITAKDCLLS